MVELNNNNNNKRDESMISNSDTSNLLNIYNVQFCVTAATSTQLTTAPSSSDTAGKLNVALVASIVLLKLLTVEMNSSWSTSVLSTPLVLATRTPNEGISHDKTLSPPSGLSTAHVILIVVPGTACNVFVSPLSVQFGPPDNNTEQKPTYIVDVKPKVVSVVL